MSASPDIRKNECCGRVLTSLNARLRLFPPDGIEDPLSEEENRQHTVVTAARMSTGETEAGISPGMSTIVTEAGKLGGVGLEPDYKTAS